MFDNVSELVTECNEIEGRRRAGAWAGTIVFGLLLAWTWAVGWSFVVPFIWLSLLLLGINHGLTDRNAELAHLLANEIERNAMADVTASTLRRRIRAQRSESQTPADDSAPAAEC